MAGMCMFIAALVLGIAVLEILKRRPYTMSGYKRTLMRWTDNQWHVQAALELYDKLGIRFSVEDEEPWFKKMVIRKGSSIVEEFAVDYYNKVVPEFDAKMESITKNGMPAIDCPPFSSPLELMMKLEISGKIEPNRKKGRFRFSIV